MGELAKWLMAGGGGAILGSIVQAIVNRRKLGAETESAEADTAAVISKTALQLLQPLRDQVRDLTEQLDRVKGKAEDLEQRLDDCKRSNRVKDDQIYELRRARATSDRERPS